MKDKKAEGYIIRLSDFKDKDRIVNIVGEEGLISFHAYGVKKITSRNASSLLPLAYSSFLLTEKNDLYTLKEGTLLKTPPYKDDLKSMASLSFIEEVSSKLIMEEDAKSAYLWLKAALEAIDKGFSPFTATLIYFAQLIELEGYGLNVDSCVICGNKRKIVGIDYEAGGFVCENEERSPGATYPGKRTLEILRYIFRCGPSDLSRVSFEDKECLLIIESLCKYVKSNLSTSFKSLKMLASSV